MGMRKWVRLRLREGLEALRTRLASESEGQLQLAGLGVVSGALAGIVMVAFRLMIEAPQAALMGAGNLENYEALPPWLRFVLPAAGGLLIGLLFHRLAAPDRQFGVVHVLERLAYHEGHLPLKNAGVQLWGAALSIVCGHSVGREGPSIHVGAACASWIGQRLHLPNPSIRVLVGCGTAGAIAAAFNTPLAGVIFAMEVVLVDYAMASFTPIIMAAVTATAVSRLVFGHEPIFQVPQTWLGSLGDLAYVVLLGVILGAISTAFVGLLMRSYRALLRRPVWLRLAIAGTLTGALAVPVPQIMGIGYDTVNDALLGGMGLGLLVAVVAVKLVATAVGLGLGLPGGLIGPTLVMGAAAGAAFGTILSALAPEGASSAGFFAMVGMGAMMGATLNAPLAALTALLELTASPQVILPGMLAIVAATLTSHQVLGTPPIFHLQMRIRGLEYRSDPITQHLRRLGVTRAIDSKVMELAAETDRPRLCAALDRGTRWILVHAPGRERRLIAAGDLAEVLAAGQSERVDLSQAGIRSRPVETISNRATLYAALRRMSAHGLDAMVVTPARGERVLGVLTREAIEQSYRAQPP